MTRKSVNLISTYNLYHSIDKLKMSSAKWIELYELSNYLVREDAANFVSVVYITDFAQDFLNSYTAQEVENKMLLN